MLFETSKEVEIEDGQSSLFETSEGSPKLPPNGLSDEVHSGINVISHNEYDASARGVNQKAQVGRLSQLEARPRSTSSLASAKSFFAVAFERFGLLPFPGKRLVIVNSKRHVGKCPEDVFLVETRLDSDNTLESIFIEYIWRKSNQLCGFLFFLSFQELEKSLRGLCSIFSEGGIREKVNLGYVLVGPGTRADFNERLLEFGKGEYETVVNSILRVGFSVADTTSEFDCSDLVSNWQVVPATEKFSDGAAVKILVEELYIEVESLLMALNDLESSLGLSEDRVFERFMIEKDIDNLQTKLKKIQLIHGNDALSGASYLLEYVIRVKEALLKEETAKLEKIVDDLEELRLFKLSDVESSKLVPYWTDSVNEKSGWGDGNNEYSFNYEGVPYSHVAVEYDVSRVRLDIVEDNPEEGRYKARIRPKKLLGLRRRALAASVTVYVENRHHPENTEKRTYLLSKQKQALQRQEASTKVIKDLEDEIDHLKATAMTILQNKNQLLQDTHSHLTASRSKLSTLPDINRSRSEISSLRQRIGGEDINAFKMDMLRVLGETDEHIMGMKGAISNVLQETIEFENKVKTFVSSLDQVVVEKMYPKAAASKDIFWKVSKGHDVVGLKPVILFLDQLGYNLTPSQALNLFQGFDTDGDKKLNQEEFAEFWAAHTSDIMLQQLGP
mmetsp:Transcript_45337/g.72799  ORF Transcript_45337/g.72799 Transcript_45337/m.72799 type:complete len:672 (+) Transcript_45337:214-2229(+)|eukprot:CAMPEP_0203758362 /NCGR_PEP_ID=MMETSP0098-20131031/11173_1 /ASSEMBLY_ACC=CAM_ASM_000208 /TAXON_ID=96639 /ORGANISM=" , Strain NY0313808BC1" /LENGTH=671 /DNA_ID=CAMNT_0050650749 /DNA_START=157 /DNA_END=2172 /DNA_ORIENTATION=-